MTRSLTDFAKVLAAIAVVGIHATSSSEHAFAAHHNYVSLDFLSVLVNQTARFSVPLFLYLSAYGLAASNKNADAGFSIGYFTFLKKRLPTILVPYFFFSSVALAMEFHSYRGPVREIAVTIIDKLQIGAADYHLYFLVILTQCYLLFPLLLRISQVNAAALRRATWLAAVLVALFLYKGTSEISLPLLGISHPGWHASFCVYWLPYFMLGIVHGRSASPPLVSANLANTLMHPPEVWKSTSRRTAMAITAALSAMTLVVIEYVYYSQQGTPVDYYNHFSRPSVMLYALAVIQLLHALSAQPHGRFSPGRGGEVARLAPLTFSVYLIHPQILRIVNHSLPSLPSFFGWILVVIVTFVLVHLLTLLTNKMTQKSPAIIAGPVQFLQRCLGLR